MHKQTLVIALFLSPPSRWRRNRKFASSPPTSRSGAPPSGGSAPMPTGNGVIFGQVKEADSNRPVAGAIVTLNLPGAQPLRVMADAQGRFGFRESAERPIQHHRHAARLGGRRLRPHAARRPDAAARSRRRRARVRRQRAAVALRLDRRPRRRRHRRPLVNVPVRVLKRSTIGGKMTLTHGPEWTDRRSRHVSHRHARTRRVRRRRADAAAHPGHADGASRANGRDAMAVARGGSAGRRAGGGGGN